MQGARGVLDEFGDGGNNRVLIVDDQEEIHDDFREMLVTGEGGSSDDLAAAFLPPRRPFLPEFALSHAASGEQACRRIEEGRERGAPTAVAYVDVRMPPGIDGIETIHRMRQVDRDIEIVIMTAYTDKSLSEIVHDMDRLHKLLYIRKPLAREEIQQITLSLVVKWNVERALASGRRQLTHSHRRLEAVLDATGDAIAMYDLDARLVFANRWYEGLFDISSDELSALPRNAAMARFAERLGDVPPAQADGRLQPDRGGGSVVEPTDFNGGGPKPLFYRSTQAVRDDNGGAIGDVVVYRELSKEIEIERMKVEVRRLRSELKTTWSVDGIVGASRELREMCSLVKQAANSDVDVLVRGESGTGKELVARALHFNGPRRNGPFRAVNCAAVPETLIESELFGHERGAFTGATSRRTGCFEEADGGTLLLDEIGDMPPALQPKLLRVLQEREVRRVGGRSTIPVDVRIVAVTNRDLGAAIREGTFREDLYYRLAVFPILIPPLRARAEDIPLLADHFVKKHAARLGRQVRGIAADAVRLLSQHAWPGNVREIENVICRALVLETTDVLRAASLPPDLRRTGPAALPAAPAPASPATREDLTLADIERQAVLAAFDGADGNMTRAARTLGIDRATLHRKLKKYGRSAGSRART